MPADRSIYWTIESHCSRAGRRIPTGALVIEQEMDLVIGLAEDKMTVDEIATMLGIPVDQADELVQQAVDRKVITISGRHSWRQPIEELEKPLRYEASNFVHRMYEFAYREYDTWAGVPREARDAALQWSLDHYIDFTHKASVEALKERGELFGFCNCRGCGICATGCPSEAIKMVELRP
jgi:ferredoxin